MRNVVKGFQFSKMAVPHLQVKELNRHFNVYHSPGLGKGMKGEHLPRRAPKMPGKNPGVY